MGDFQRAGGGGAWRQTPRNPAPQPQPESAKYQPQIRRFPTEQSWREHVHRMWVEHRIEEPDLAYCPYGCGGVGMFRRNVPIDDPDFGRAFPCQCKLEERAARATMRGVEQRSSLPPEQRGLTLDTFTGDKEARLAALASLNAQNGILTLRGPNGVGKTWLLTAMVNECLKRGIPAHYAVVPRMLDGLRAAIGNGTFDEEMEWLKECPVLALDEFNRVYDKAAAYGAAGTVGWASEKMFDLVDYRYANYHRLLTLVATNRMPDDMGGDPALESRLTHQTRCRTVIMGALGDLRPQAAVWEQGLREVDDVDA